MARDHDPVTLEDEGLWAAITASLERSIRGEPSPDFLARVRDQLARERARPVARGWPTWLAVATPVPIVLAVVAALVVKLTLPVPEDTTPAPSAAPAARIPQAPPITRVTPPAAPVTRKKPRTERVARDAEILVEPGQLDALVRVATSRVGRFEFVVYAPEVTTPLPPLQPVELPRFQPKSLQVTQRQWKELKSDAGDVTSDGNEGSEP